MFFLVFIGFLYPPPARKVFLSGQKSSPKDFLLVVVVYVFSSLIFYCRDSPGNRPGRLQLAGLPETVRRGHFVRQSQRPAAAAWRACLRLHRSQFVERVVAAAT